MHERTFRRCIHCTRKIFIDYGLGEWNLQRHEDACISQQAQAHAKTARVASRKYRKRIRASGDIEPGIGQFGFKGFDGVPQEVVG